MRASPNLTYQFNEYVYGPTSLASLATFTPPDKTLIFGCTLSQVGDLGVWHGTAVYVANALDLTANQFGWIGGLLSGTTPRCRYTNRDGAAARDLTLTGLTLI